MENILQFSKGSAFLEFVIIVIYGNKWNIFRICDYCDLLLICLFGAKYGKIKKTKMQNTTNSTYCINESKLR